MKSTNDNFKKIDAFLMANRKYNRCYYGWPYLIAFIVLLTIEVLIAFNYYNHFIRSYVGDVLVVVLLYCLIRSFIDIKSRLLPWALLGFAALVELTQLMGLAEMLGAKPGSLLSVVLGSTFDWHDLVSYFFGAVIAAFVLEVETCFIRPWWKRCMALIRNSVK